MIPLNEFDKQAFSTLNARDEGFYYNSKTGDKQDN